MNFARRHEYNIVNVVRLVAAIWIHVSKYGPKVGLERFWYRARCERVDSTARRKTEESKATNSRNE